MLFRDSITLLTARFPAILGLLITDPVDLSLRKLLAVTIRLPFKISRSVSSWTMLSSVAMPLGSTQTGRALVELPAAPEAFVAFLLGFLARLRLLNADCVLAGMLDDRLVFSSCKLQHAKPRYRYTDPSLLVKHCTLVHLRSRSRYIIQKEHASVDNVTPVHIYTHTR